MPISSLDGSNIKGFLGKKTESGLGSGGSGSSQGRGSSSNLPQSSNIIFQHNLFDGSSTPQIGSESYTRSGTLVVHDTFTTVASYADNVMPFGVRRGGSETMKGAWLGGSVKNWILRSEEFDNASWVAVGGGSATANTATAPDGTLTADTISGSSAGDGLTQDSSTAAGSVSWVGSVWLKTSTGTNTVKIIVTDGTQSNFVECPLTTTWRRFQVPKLFFSASGTTSFQIIVGNSSSTRVWGAQLERFNLSNTLGSRDRRSIANEYVKTTSAVASTSNSNLEIPNSIFSQIATTGSISLWTLAEWDWADINNGGASPTIAQYLFSGNFDVLSLHTEKDAGLILNINSAQVARTSTTGFNQTLYNIEPSAWTHVTVTWNVTTDVYKIYLNGFDATGTTGTASAIVTGSEVLNFGCNHATNFPYVCSDAFLSEIVIWKTALTSTEVSTVYNNKSAIARRSAPSDGKIFSVALGTSLVPTVGDTEYEYNVRGGGSFYYANSTTTLAASSALTYPAPAYPLNGANKGGFPFVSRQQNVILQSEAIGTTWAAVGAPTITEAGGTFLGTLNYGTILGVDTEGITQTVATAIATTGWLGSVYASVSSGTLACRLTLEGDSGGTPEVTNADITLTTTPTRYEVYKRFTGAATGNIKFSFKLRASGTARVGGFQLEQEYPESTIGTLSKKPAPYVKTTTAAASYRHNQIVYRAIDSFNIHKGTAIAWAFLDSDPSTDWISGNGPVLIAAPGQYGGFYWHTLPTLYRAMWSGTSPYVEDITYAPTTRQWTHYALTWDTSVPEMRIYIDGVLKDTANTASKLATQRKLMIGGDGYFGPMDFWQGAVDTIDIYGEAKDTSTILADFNATKATYGR